MLKQPMFLHRMPKVELAKWYVTHLFTRKLKLILLLLSISITNSYGQTFIGNYGDIGKVANVGDQVFFAADDGVHGKELWVTKGSKKNTSLVKDICPGNRGSSPSDLISYKGVLYFSAYDNINGTELWKSDGTEEGTQMVKNIRPNSGGYDNGSNPMQFLLWKGELYFTASHTGNSRDIWKTDGTSEGTVKVSEGYYNAIYYLRIVGDDLFYIRRHGYGELIKMDGETNRVSDYNVDDYTGISDLVSTGKSLYFIAHTTYRNEIRFYHFDPVSEEFTLLLELGGGHEFGNVTVVDDKVFFSVRKDAYGKEEDVLWKTDGTTAGTVPVKTFGWAPHWSNSFMQNFIAFKDVLYFRASNEAGFYLYKSDGTEAGTKQVAEVSMEESVKPIIANDKLYFSSRSRELWESDGTTAGTVRISPVYLFNYTNASVLHNVDGIVYYKGQDEYGTGLWNTNPNSEIKVKVDYRTYVNNASINLRSKVDSCTVQKVEIRNAGNKELCMSKVVVTGNDFFLSGEIDQFIQPGEKNSFYLHYFPFTEGESKCMLDILSNDLNEGVFRLNITGNCEGVSSAFNADTVKLAHMLTPHSEDEASKLKLDNNEILENSTSNTTVGLVSLYGKNDVEFSLVEGLGDRDNVYFSIEDNQLIAKESFDFEEDNAYSIRIKGSVRESNESYENPFVIDVVNVNEDIAFDACGKQVRNESYALTGVVFLDNNTVIAIGESGTIIKSKDGGENWYKVSTETIRRLFAIQRIDSKTAYVIGDYGKLLKTVNGGDDWFLVDFPNPEYPYPRDLFFINEDVGYLFGGKNNILKTTDGCKTWKALSVTPYDIAGGYFINEDKGFVFGGSLYMTDDGGDTWVNVEIKDLPFSNSFVDIQFVNEKTGFLLGRKGRVYKTTNGGEKWVKVGTMVTDYATVIHFKNESIGYATGSWDGSLIYKTEDGGVTWEPQNEWNYFHNTIALDFSPDYKRGCAVGFGSSLGSTGESGRTIINMQDNEWHVHSSLQEANYKSISCLDDATTIIFGEKNIKSKDYGLTWNPIDIPLKEPKDHTIIESFFVNNEVGFAIDHFSIYKTIDGGDNWTRFDSDIEAYERLVDIYFFNENLGFVFGWSESIYRTVDAGANWEKIEGVNQSTAIEDMYFLDSQRGFAISGNPSKILQTEDGGLSWKALNSYSGTWLRTIDFFDDQKGVALGDDGFELRTVDGGMTWKEVSTGIGYDFKSTFFFDSEKGYVANSNGGVYETLDAGETWLKAYNTTSFNDLDVMNNNVWLVGARATLYSVTDDNKQTMPGYIAGTALAPLNSTLSYSIPQSYGTHYSWEVNGDNQIEYNLNKAKVTWNELGDFSIKVTSYNSCGTGKTRELVVKVTELPEPEILGADTVVINSQEDYQAKHSLGSRISWNVQGAQNSNPNDDIVTVDWGDIGKGKIMLRETNTESGARGYAVLDVIIVEDKITSTTIDALIEAYRVYPNPTTDFVHVDVESSQNETIIIRILDNLGKVLKIRQFESYEDIRIDVSDLPSGLYFMNMQVGKTSKSIKILKK
ncbi:T9SS type A sorting domain-containing protein [Puteibacter caeruleilacunae]|nr:T9SS type A sorting domain-containing protein [Puteibacter caeruleilacunae]